MQKNLHNLIRVYEVAEELNTTSKEIIESFSALNIYKKNHLALISSEELKLLYKQKGLIDKPSYCIKKNEINKDKILPNPEEIKKLYKKIQKNNKSSKYIKVDFHVHTPASKDYVRVSKNNTDEEEYRLLLSQFSNCDTQVITITDHNSFEGYFRIMDIINQDPDVKSKLSGKLILPGVEITCFGKHFLIIFPESIDKGKLDIFMLECGIGSNDQGVGEISADRVTPITLCELAERNQGMVIIPHCDAENGLLESYFDNKDSDFSVRGSSIKRVLQSNAVYGICINSLKNIDRLKDILRNFRLNNLPILQSSDSHSSQKEYKGSGLPLGERASWIKLGCLSYKSICLALKNSFTNVHINRVEEKINPAIIGICIKGGFIKHKDSSNEWAIIPLSDELNCIIGARGTGKSTFLDILRYVFDPNNIDLGKSIINRFNAALVFIKEKNIEAILFKPIGLKKHTIKRFVFKDEIFQELKSSTFNSLLCNKSTLKSISLNLQSYRQKELLHLATQELGPTILIENLCSEVYKKKFEEVSNRIEWLKNSITDHCRDLLKERRFDKNADLSSDYLKSKFQEYLVAHKTRIQYHKSTIDQLNDILNDKLRITYSVSIPKMIYENIIYSLLRKERNKNNMPYSYEVEYRKILFRLFQKIKSDDWAVPYYIFTGDYKKLSETCDEPETNTRKICKVFSKLIDPVDVIKLPYIVSDYLLNVNHGSNSKSLYVCRENLSFGQKAVGMLLIILQGTTELGECRPLLIDQPEDDLDNSYIYYTLVKEFHRIKQNRQLIIATHNPNIPLAGDAENILVFNSDGQNGWVERSGTIDNKAVSEKVLQILEGDFEAFLRRAVKYGFRLGQDN